MMKHNFRVYKTAELAIMFYDTYPKLFQPKNCFHIFKMLPNTTESSILYRMAIETSSIYKINQQSMMEYSRDGKCSQRTSRRLLHIQIGLRS